MNHNLVKLAIEKILNEIQDSIDNVTSIDYVITDEHYFGLDADVFIKFDFPTNLCRNNPAKSHAFKLKFFAAYNEREHVYYMRAQLVSNGYDYIKSHPLGSDICEYDKSEFEFAKAQERQAITCFRHINEYLCE